MFSVSDIYTRLKLFKESLGPRHDKLYFAKIDVKAAFDTIPQPAVIKLMGSIPSQDKYTIMKHAEVKPGERALLECEKSSSKAIRRWHATALAEGEPFNFTARLERDLAGKKKNTVFVDSAMRKTHSVGELLRLLNQHVEQNLVKVGKKYYRQKIGIPQGSVLSSFLCNYFYADLEAQYLGFLASPDTLLLRLIDDFLLVTLDRDKAVRFVDTMHQGVPEYGVVVNPAKTLVNFDMSHDGTPVRKVDGQAGFPYCGTTINCQTLDITKDRHRDAHLGKSDFPMDSIRYHARTLLTLKQTYLPLLQLTLVERQVKTSSAKCSVGLTSPLDYIYSLTGLPPNRCLQDPVSSHVL